jgi:hypothetical protein
MLHAEAIVAAVRVVVAHAARVIGATRREARGAHARVVRQTLQERGAVQRAAGRRSGAIDARRQPLCAARAIAGRASAAATRFAHAARALSVCLAQAAGLAARAERIGRPAIEIGLAAVQHAVVAARGAAALRVARQRAAAATAYPARALGGERARAPRWTRQCAEPSAVYPELVLIAHAVAARGRRAAARAGAAAARAIGARAASRPIRATRALAAAAIDEDLDAIQHAVVAGLGRAARA